MPIVARLTGVGTFFAYDYDEITVAKFRVGSDGTAYSNEFDENTASTLTGTKRMSATSTGGLIVLDSINEIDPIETAVPTTGLQLNIDPATSTKTETLPVGQTAYTTAQTTTFTVPGGCTSISAVCVGGGGGGGARDQSDEPGGGGGGGALAYRTFSVTPGESLTVTVGAGGNGGTGGNDGTAGGTTSISRGGTVLVSAAGGGGGEGDSGGGGAGGSARTGDGGGNGGNGGSCNDGNNGAGGGGAGGYSGNGGNGANGGTTNTSGTAGSGGGGGGSGTASDSTSGGGGGVGILGAGANGTAGPAGGNGGGGSGGAAGNNNGGAYGGGGGGAGTNTGTTTGRGGGGGAVRIIWGTGRSYPSTSVTDATVVNYSFTLSDLSGNGRTASSVNGAYWLSTNSGVVAYDGVNDYMTNSAYKGITGTGARTSIIWFKALVPNIAYRLFGWGTTAAGGKWNISLDATTFRPRVEIATGSVLANTSAPNVTDGGWYMIAASAPASGTANNIKLYINGDLITDTTITSGATAINTISGSDVSHGASIVDAAPGYLNGNTSQFLIYNTQLTDLEIKQVYRTILNRF
jgi:hypothetical protein